MIENLFTPPKQVRGTLLGTDSNAFSLMARFKTLAKEQGWPKEDIELVLDECKKGDYHHLLAILNLHMDGRQNKSPKRRPQW